ncbi:O-methyltransferase [Fusarium beomiforme]|uniref:O-methyltransferase n=1 Tax=Fusarium beomiforme TaxID=44412 RepID=A0A9P5AAU6_9HYPO|nr:O-methyltransferase [Fusarium beomiforme]
MSLLQTLVRLEASLTAFISVLTKDEVKKELKELLHNQQDLPDKQVLQRATSVVDKLGEMQAILEPAHLVLADHFFGYTDTKCLVAAVDLDVPDHLASGSKTLEQLATMTNAKPLRLGQILRPLYTKGIFCYDAVTGKYALNHVSRLLLKDHATQWHNWVTLYGNQFFDIARGIPEAVCASSSRCAAQVNFDTDLDMFAYFESQGWVPQLHKTLGAGARAMAPGILADYPWHEIGNKTVMDIGGGSGALLASLLRANPGMIGALFDRPAVIEHITPFFSKGGHFEDLAARVPRGNLIAGNFLEEVPKYEVYTMKWCLHDWDDETVVKILKNIREAIIVTESSRLVVLESVLSDTRSGRLSVYGDINMMMTVGGQERTEAKWNELAERAAEELKAPYVLSIVDTKDEWFYKIHPERYVPSLKDRDPETGQDVIVFEGTACLQYLADRWDTMGEWTGRTAAEKGAVLSWTAYQTAGLGATAKYWLYFLKGYPNRQEPVQLPRTIEKLHQNTTKQWDILNKRLTESGQRYIALKDRPTLADLSYLPFAMPWMFNLFGAFLSRLHQVRDVGAGKPFPSARYTFPGGQGDAAKFLHGKENSVKWEAEYGSIYRIWSGPNPEVVLTRPEDVQQVFKDSDKHIKAVNNNSGYVLGELLGKCVGLVSQNEWKQVRQVSEVAFLRNTVPTYLEIMQKRTMRHFKTLAAGNNLPNGIIDPAADLKMLPFWIIADVLYGRLSREMENTLAKLAPLREDIFRKVMEGGLSRFHWSRFFPTETNKSLESFKEQWIRFNRDALDRALHAGSRAPIVGLYDAVTLGTMTQEHLLHTLDETLFANLDVTLGALSWNLVFLAAYPEHQRCILDEVRRWKQSPKGEDYNNYFTDSTTYLSACILESSRLRPLAAFSVPQAIPTDRVINGYLFPAGTNFIVDAYALNQRNPFWGL